MGERPTTDDEFLTAVNRALQKQHAEKWRNRKLREDFDDARVEVIGLIEAEIERAELQQHINGQINAPETTPGFDEAVITLLYAALSAVKDARYAQ